MKTTHPTAHLVRHPIIQRIGRRDVLRGLGAFAIVGAMPLVGCGDPRSSALPEALATFYSDPDAAAEIGRHYLALTPRESDADVLVRAVAGDELELFRKLAIENPSELHELLRAKHREDFDGGRVVVVEGWMLSLTEARLCAIASL